MAKNLIPEIARMLGVEIGEEFKVDRYEYNGLTCKFAENMLMSRSDLKGAEWGITYVILSELLAGDAEIVKIPWKPKKGETYWGFLYSQRNDAWLLCLYTWGNNPEDCAFYKAGWVFHTKEEAKAALPAVAKEMGVEYKL